MKITGMPHGSSVGDPVAAAADRRAGLLAKIELVDNCAFAVGGGRWYTALIQNICMAKPYAMLDRSFLPSSDRNSFFRARKEFFVRLNASKGGVDSN